jgi:hypothetical protein
MVNVFGLLCLPDMPIFRNSKYKMMNKLLRDRRNVINALYSMEAKDYARANVEFREKRERVLEDVDDPGFWQELESACEV